VQTINATLENKETVTITQPERGKITISKSTLVAKK
jgi:hypothetical protein